MKTAIVSENQMSLQYGANSQLGQVLDQVMGLNAQWRQAALSAMRLGDECSKRIQRAVQGIDFQALANRYEQIWAALAAHGWFPSMFHTPINIYDFLVGRLEAGAVADCDNWMTAHFRQHLGEILREVAAEFPHRSFPLQEAFRAHEAGYFSLSIPAVLVQADGIGHDIFGLSPCSRRPSNLVALRNWVKSNAKSQLLTVFWQTIAQPLPIRAKCSENTDPPSLNRHAVLHGLDLSYISEINSAKAISWLHYIVSFQTLKVGG